MAKKQRSAGDDARKVEGEVADQRSLASQSAVDIEQPSCRLLSSPLFPPSGPRQGAPVPPARSDRAKQKRVKWHGAGGESFYHIGVSSEASHGKSNLCAQTRLILFIVLGIPNNYQEEI